MKRKVKPFYLPIRLIISQIISIWIFKIITRWPGMLYWMKNLLSIFKISAGTTGIGCFGIDYHYVFELTSRCNLSCKHCHVGNAPQNEKELNTDQIKKVLEDLATLPKYKLIVFTGGEPLLRKDIFEIIEYARKLGFYPVLATNATLIDKHTALKLKKAGILGIATSIDSTDPSTHDDFRGSKGCFQQTLEGIENVKSLGMYVQINITVSKMNLNELPAILKFSDSIGAHVVLLYQLILTGKAKQIKNQMLSAEELKHVMELTFEMQSKIKPVVIPVGLPEYFPYIMKKTKLPEKLTSKYFKGCIAGKRGTFYIKPNGDIWPCPMLPVTIGNIAQSTARQIWQSGEIFNQLNNRNNIKGQCGQCQNRESCGGCRAKAYALSGDIFSEIPDCPLKL